MIGIEFKLKNGTSDHYDPVNYPSDFEETETHYILNMAYRYEIEKSTVESIRHYELCEKCGSEMINDKCGSGSYPSCDGSDDEEVEKDRIDKLWEKSDETIDPDSVGNPNRIYLIGCDVGVGVDKAVCSTFKVTDGGFEFVKSEPRNELLRQLELQRIQQGR